MSINIVKGGGASSVPIRAFFRDFPINFLDVDRTAYYNMIVYSSPECNVSTPLNTSIWSTYAVVVAVNAKFTARETNKKSFPVPYIYSISLEFQDCRSLYGCLTMFCQVIGKLHKLFFGESFEVVLLSFLSYVAFPLKIEISSTSVC